MKYIINANKHLTGIAQGEVFYVGKKLSEIENSQLLGIGFPSEISEGISLLGRAIGPVSRRNVYGSHVKLKHLPKETLYRDVCVKDWHGNYHYVDIPYQRYKRNHIPAPEVELHVRSINDQLYILSDQLLKNDDRQEYNKHIINLFLEYFGSFEILDGNMQSTFHELPVHRVNWEILPPGDYPWEHIPSEGIKLTGKNNKIRQQHIYDHIYRHSPSSITIGRGGLSGYIAFDFQEKGFVLLEHISYGNATYVFDNNWEQYSQLTKREIISGDLQRSRIIHREGWEHAIDSLFN